MCTRKRVYTVIKYKCICNVCMTKPRGNKLNYEKVRVLKD